MRQRFARSIQWIFRHPRFLVIGGTVALFLVLYSGYQNGVFYIFLHVENFADAATLMLVAATLVVTGVGVLAAMLAVWGYKEIKDAATKAAVDEAIKEVKATVPALVARALMESRPVETGPRDADAIAEAVEKDQDEP